MNFESGVAVVNCVGSGKLGIMGNKTIVSRRKVTSNYVIVFIGVDNPFARVRGILNFCSKPVSQNTLYPCTKPN